MSKISLTQQEKDIYELIKEYKFVFLDTLKNIFSHYKVQYHVNSLVEKGLVKYYKVAGENKRIVKLRSIKVPRKRALIFRLYTGYVASIEQKRLFWGNGLPIKRAGDFYWVVDSDGIWVMIYDWMYSISWLQEIYQRYAAANVGVWIITYELQRKYEIRECLRRYVKKYNTPLKIFVLENELLWAIK